MVILTSAISARNLLPHFPGKHVFPGKLFEYIGKYYYSRKKTEGVSYDIELTCYFSYDVPR